LKAPRAVGLDFLPIDAVFTPEEVVLLGHEIVSGVVSEELHG
jgi:hypothetical protein